ncbi:MAG: helix-turn-helix domain-containing protein [Corallococcus sp.]|nr:helix-turn-helix domain-containing protein [Corallococcus sp.]
MEFKDRLKQYRAEHNLTQEDLANRLCVSRQAVSKYETGVNYPNLDVMSEIAKMLGVTLDELLSKEEITKEAISSNVSRQKNKRNIIVSIIAALLIAAISVTAIVLSVAHLKPAYDNDLQLVGIVGSLNGEIPDIEALEQGKLFGYCYTVEGDKLSGRSYNLSGFLTKITGVDAFYIGTGTTLQISKDFKMSCSITMDVTLFYDVDECYLFAVYYDEKSESYAFEPCYTVCARSKVLVSVGKGEQRWGVTLNFKHVDELSRITIYEYAMDAELLKSFKWNGETSYVISDDCLYAVIEEKFVGCDGSEYYNRKIVDNSQIADGYFYSVPILNANGFASTVITLRK